jgi:hypothetical protein
MFGSFFLDPSVPGHPPCAHFPKLQTLCIMMYAKTWEHPTAVATLSSVILLSARINSSTRSTVASVAISTGRLGPASSATFERPRENFSTQVRTALRYKHFPP